MDLVSVAAYVAAGGFIVLALFQAAIALGAPVGRAAWGGRNPGVLPRNLRIASALAVFIYVIASLIVLDRGGVPLVDLSDTFSYWGTWVLVVLLAVGAVMNAASSSPFERFGWAPFAAVMAVLTLMVAIS